MERTARHQAMAEQTGRLVVKHTFIEVVDAFPADGARLRPRASSDSALFESGELEARRQHLEEQWANDRNKGEVEFDLSGISDTETNPECELTVPLPCYQHIEELEDEPVISSNGSSSTASYDCRGNGPFGLLKFERAEGRGSADCHDRSVSGCSSTPEITQGSLPQQQPSQQQVDQLVSANARLSLENEMLRRRCEQTLQQAAREAAAAETRAAAVADAAAEAASVAVQQQPFGAWFVPLGFMPNLAAGAMPLHGVGCLQAPAPAAPRRQRAKRATARARAGAGSAVEQLTASVVQNIAAMQGISLSVAAAPVPVVGPTIEEVACDVPPELRTTVMLRNLPNNYSRVMVLSMLDDEGFAGLYNFLYLPIDFKSRACLGYAFVNMVDPSVVPNFWMKFNGYSKWVLPSKKVCGVSWSGPHQGLEAHVERYRNSPVMHNTVPDEYKPVVCVNGTRVTFPPPTKTPRAPRVRNHSENKAHWTWLQPQDGAAAACCTEASRA